MPNTTLTQQALSRDPEFILRISSTLIAVAYVVKTEGPPVQSNPVSEAEAIAMNIHNLRQNYARQVLENSDLEGLRVAKIITARTNVNTKVTSWSGTPQLNIITSAADEDLFSQVSADWNIYAGV